MARKRLGYFRILRSKYQIFLYSRTLVVTNVKKQILPRPRVLEIIFLQICFHWVESLKIEFFKYNYKRCSIPTEIGKIHKLPVVLVELSQIYKQHYKFCFILKYHYFRCSTIPKYFFEKLQNNKKNPIVNICDGIVRVRRLILVSLK